MQKNSKYLPHTSYTSYTQYNALAVLRRAKKAVRMSATHTKTKNLTILKALRMTAMTSKMAIVRARLACPTASTHGTENTV